MKTNKIIALLLSVACSIGLFSCSDDSDLQPLGNPSVSSTGLSYESLSFSWNAIPNAVQYGYRLTDESGEYSLAGVTKKTEVNFNGLQAATTYKLEVWAFAAIDGDYSTPPAVTLTATTDPLIKLATPTLTIEEVNGNATAKWTSVDNADSYDYEVTASNNEIVASGNTDKTSLAVKGLPEGDYRFSLYATTSKGGYERSDAATATFHVNASEIWRANGTYYSIELNSSWPATIVAYSNSTYVLLAYYGVEGYNLEIAVNESVASDKFSFINGELYESNGWKCWNVPTGLSVPDKIWAYPWDNYSYFSGDETGGEIGIGLYYGDDFEWGYDTFTWGGAELDINSLPGTYATHCYGVEKNDDTGWKAQEFDYSGYDSTILLEGDNIISLDGFYWDECPVFGEVDTENKTIIFEPQDLVVYDDGEKYAFGGKNNSADSVTATVNADGSISLVDFAIWYVYTDGTPDYLCVYGTADLTKSTASKISMRKSAPVKSAKTSIKRKSTSPSSTRPRKR